MVNYFVNKGNVYIGTQVFFLFPKKKPFNYLYFFSLSVSLTQVQSKKELKMKIMLNEQRFPWKQIKALPKEKKTFIWFLSRTDESALIQRHAGHSVVPGCHRAAVPLRIMVIC